MANATSTAIRPVSWRLTKSWRYIVILAACATLFYGIAGCLFTAACIGEKHRWRGINRGPKDWGLNNEVVSLHSTDGISLKAWWLPSQEPARATVIIVHGVDHTRQVMLPRAAFLVHGGYNVLALDLRGHGESAAQYTSPGYLESRDVLGAIRYVRDRGDRAPIVLLGVSLGAAAVVIAAAQSKDVAAVVADGIFPSGAEVFENISRGIARDRRMKTGLRAAAFIATCPGIPTSASLVYFARTGVWLGPDLVNVLSYAAQIRIPILFISGTHDWIVPTDQVRKVMAAAPSRSKSLITIPDAQHDTTFSTAPALYRSAVLSFLDDNLPKLADQENKR
jgi:alpha-beta hydrolase superfamily lysophospholipase